jgi:membrane protease YdiL (CAAX protease family)
VKTPEREKNCWSIWRIGVPGKLFWFEDLFPENPGLIQKKISQVHNSVKQTPIQKVLHFFLTKMIVGIAVIVSLVVCVEWLHSLILDKTNLSDDAKALIVAVAEAFIATTGYIFLFRVYDKRRIHELSAALFIDNAVKGFLTGIILQSLFILIIYLAGTFFVVNVNPVSTMISPFAFALTAGFVAEIIIIGIVFRLLEDQTGTEMALVIFIILFAVLHVNAKGATVTSVGATAIHAGFMLPAAYVYSRNLWLPIFLHLGGTLRSPESLEALIQAVRWQGVCWQVKLPGNSLLTGGETGPQDSLSSIVLCLLLGLIFLFLAKRKNNLMKRHLGTTVIDI